MSFTIESFYNPHLAIGTTRTDAVLTVTSTAERAITTSKLDFLFLLDVSGSMNENDKLNHAKIALRRALTMLPQNANFGIVVFNDKAKMLVPLEPVNAISIDKAQKLVQGLQGSSGTAMSTALKLAKKQFSANPDNIKVAQLLTDGENADEDQNFLLKEIEDCKGIFQCNCRGIGTAWRPDQLRLIANNLLGTADAIAEGDGLEQDFKATIEKASNLGISNVVLRLWSPKTAKIVSVKQVMPEILDLMPMAQVIDEKTIDFPIGSWGNEARDYHVGIELVAGVEGDEVLACRPVVVYNSIKVTGPNVVASWTGNEQLTTRINSQVAHYTGQTELADSIKEGLEAQASGDVDLATKLLGRAVQLADKSGNEEVTRRLRKVVDVVDASQGTVRIKLGANKAAVLELDMGGTRTVRKRNVNT